VILSLVLELPPHEGAIFDWFIWSIFFIDYSVRFIKSENMVMPCGGRLSP